MGRKSTVAALPKELVEACNGLIRDGHTIDQILTALQVLGADVSRSAVGRYVKQASRIALVKLVLHPIVLLAVGWLWGLRGLPLVVLATAAALPVGANVFLFTQRYEVGREEVTASIAVSTSLALLTIPLILLGLAQLLKLG